MPETEVVDSSAAPESISPDVLPSVEADPVTETPEGASSETTEEPRSWKHDDWKEHPEFQEWFEDQRYEHQLNGQEREYGRTQQTIQKIREELTTKADTATTALNTFNSLAAKAIEELGPQGFAQELARNGVLDSYRQAAELSQSLKTKKEEFGKDDEIHDAIKLNVANAMLAMAELAGDSEMAKPFIARFGKEYVLDEEHRGYNAYTKFVKSVLKAAEDKGYQKGLNAGKGVSEEVSKAQERSGKAPPMVGGSNGNRPSVAQYAAASSEQRAKWREEGIEPRV